MAQRLGDRVGIESMRLEERLKREAFGSYD
jgi:hypothetical protein